MDVLDESLDHTKRFQAFPVVLWQMFHNNRKYTARYIEEDLNHISFHFLSLQSHNQYTSTYSYNPKQMKNGVHFSPPKRHRQCFKCIVPFFLINSGKTLSESGRTSIVIRIGNVISFFRLLNVQGMRQPRKEVVANFITLLLDIQRYAWSS